MLGHQALPHCVIISLWTQQLRGRRQERPSGFTELHVSLVDGQAGISLCAGNYNLSNVLPNAPDMAQFKQGVRSVAGKLSVFANGVMTSIQVSEALLELPGDWAVAMSWELCRRIAQTS